MFFLNFCPHNHFIQTTTDSTASDTVFLLGGDTYSQDFTQRDLIPGLQDTMWETGYKNDGTLLKFQAHHSLSFEFTVIFHFLLYSMEYAR